MKTIRLLVVVALCTIWTAPLVAVEWKVGIAKTEITPKSPLWMAGYASRMHPSEGAIHPLWAKAMVVEDQRGGWLALVASDIIGFTREVGDAVGRRVEEQTGITRERILLNSSHTHCGPVVLGCADIAHHMEAEHVAAAAKYQSVLEEKVVQVIVDACRAMQPAKLAYGEGKATFAMNRRTVRGDGYVISPNAEGPVDHTVPVLRVSDENDRPLAVLFGYACHNTTLGGDIYEYNGDYAGFAQIQFEAKHPGVTALFMTGCGADSNPQPRGKIEHAEAHGKTLAAAVDDVLSGKLDPVGGPLSVAFERVDLPFVDPPGKQELQERVGQGNVYQKRLTKLLLKRIEEKGKVDAAYPFPVQVVRFGNNFCIVALAGEVVVDYSLRLRNEFDGLPLWVAGYSNEVFAYVPSERVLAEGGYEGGGAMVYFGWHGPFKPGVEDLVVDTVRKLMDRTKNTATSGKESE